MDNAKEDRYPIDRGWAWVVLLACTFQQLFLIGTHASFGILFNEFTTKFNSSATSISIALSVQTVTLSLLSLLVLNIGPRLLPYRVFIMLGGVVGFSAYILNAFLPNISFLILSQGILYGMTHACTHGPSLVILGQYFKKYRGLATTLANVGASVGVLVFPLILRALLNTYELRGALIIQSGILLNFFVVGGLLRPLSFYDKSSRKKSKKLDSNDEEHTEKLLQDQNTKTANGKSVENERSHAQMNKRSVPKETKNCSEHSQDILHEISGRDHLEPFIRNRTYSDSRREQQKRCHHHHLKPETHHSTRSLNRIIDNVAISGDLAIASSTGDIVGSMYSIHSQDTRFNNKNMNSGGEAKKSQHNCMKILHEIIGFHCLKIRIFQIWMVVAFFAILGAAQLITYVPPLAAEKGIEENDRVLLLTVLGASDLSGKFILIFLTRFNILPKDLMMAAALWILSVGIICMPMMTEFSGLSTLASVMGSSTGVYFSLFPAVLADFVGLENLSGAMGLTMLVHGLSLTIGNPILGAIKDGTGSFVGSFLYAGVCTVISATAMTVCYFYQKKRNKQLPNRHDVIETIVTADGTCQG
ncbi:monocarboxylate transporter 5-like [Saccostrea echinata]|uniref:monocarboxylate transporter 5-like n=1 Tax=Saccostrea echinata TaxID=191078 RepID=UPI002A81ABC4|nr:monocarboxylate transporter 5-like [Saccostrea echinata]